MKPLFKVFKKKYFVALRKPAPRKTIIYHFFCFNLWSQGFRVLLSLMVDTQLGSPAENKLVLLT